MSPAVCLIRMVAALAAAACATGAYANGKSTPTPTKLEFQAQAQRTAANDMGYATAYVELTGPNASEIAQQANTAISAALALAKAKPSITVRTGSSHTSPIYGKTKTAATNIESWRIRSELNLETRNFGALGDLLGQLQNSGMAVSDVSFAPSPETRRKVEDDTAIDAIRIFREKATRYAGALKRSYRIRSLDINTAGSRQPMLRAAPMMAAEANEVPLEAGASVVVVNINGQIELIE